MSGALRAAALALLLLIQGGFAACAQDRAAAAKPVRLAIVNTPKMSGLIDALAEDFRSKSGISVEVASGSDVYERARNGEADIVISHYGKAGVESFVLEGFGLWPKTVFSNQLVIVGPKSDPAGIKGLASATEAFRRIASTKAPFQVNDLPGIGYVSDVLWAAAGQPQKGEWYLNTGDSKGRAMRAAEDSGAYTVWGAYPFLRFKEKHNSELEIMVTSDPLLHRVMVAIVVNPAKIAGANKDGAEAFETYLLSASTQAKIAAFRSAGSDQQLWWPAARNNNAEGMDE